MPGYKHMGKADVRGVSAGRIDQGAVPTPARHERAEENTTPGLPKPMDKAPGQYTANESVPSMDRCTPGAPDMENPGSYAKRFM